MSDERWLSALTRVFLRYAQIQATDRGNSYADSTDTVAATMLEAKREEMDG